MSNTSIHSQLPCNHIPPNVIYHEPEKGQVNAYFDLAAHQD